MTESVSIRRTAVDQETTGAYVSKKSTPSFCLSPLTKKRALWLLIVPLGDRFRWNAQVPGNTLAPSGREALSTINQVSLLFFELLDFFLHGLGVPVGIRSIQSIMSARKIGSACLCCQSKGSIKDYSKRAGKEIRERESRREKENCLRPRWSSSSSWSAARPTDGEKMSRSFTIMRPERVRRCGIRSWRALILRRRLVLQGGASQRRAVCWASLASL